MFLILKVLKFGSLHYEIKFKFVLLVFIHFINTCSAIKFWLGHFRNCKWNELVERNNGFNGFLDFGQRFRNYKEFLELRIIPTSSKKK